MTSALSYFAAMPVRSGPRPGAPAGVPPAAWHRAQPTPPEVWWNNAAPAFGSPDRCNANARSPARPTSTGWAARLPGFGSVPGSDSSTRNHQGATPCRARSMIRFTPARRSTRTVSAAAPAAKLATARSSTAMIVGPVAVTTRSAARARSDVTSATAKIVAAS